MVASIGKTARRALKISCLLVAATSLVAYLSSSTSRTATWSRLASRAVSNPRGVNNLPINEIRESALLLTSRCLLTIIYSSPVSLASTEHRGCTCESYPSIYYCEVTNSL